MTERESFEQWAQMPPRQWQIMRFDDDVKHYRAGDYCTPFVQYAWEAWQAGRDAAWAEMHDSYQDEANSLCIGE